LVKRGVSADRLVARGLGATNFIASNATADGRRQNRRIELVVVRS
jgi:outer membrane protein OmpA-like peptidoglycan-associated protein